MELLFFIICVIIIIMMMMITELIIIILVLKDDHDHVHPFTLIMVTYLITAISCVFTSV